MSRHLFFFFAKCALIVSLFKITWFHYVHWGALESWVQCRGYSLLFSATTNVLSRGEKTRLYVMEFTNWECFTSQRFCTSFLFSIIYLTSRVSDIKQGFKGLWIVHASHNDKLHLSLHTSILPLNSDWLTQDIYVVISCSIVFAMVIVIY